MSYQSPIGPGCNLSPARDSFRGAVPRILVLGGAGLPKSAVPSTRLLLVPLATVGQLAMSTAIETGRFNYVYIKRLKHSFSV